MALMKECVVVPIDFSGNSVQSISAALEYVDDPSKVHVIHVVMPLDNMSPGVVWGTIDDPSRLRAVEDHFGEFLKEHGIEGVTRVVRIGNPGSEIDEYARETKAELIVIPSHGYHGVKRFLLGSVAERVLRYSPCPVLVLKREDAEQD